MGGGGGVGVILDAPYITCKQTNVFILSAVGCCTHVCGSSKLNAYSCLPEWIVVRPSSELSSSEK